MKPGLRRFLLAVAIGLPMLLVSLTAVLVYLLHQPEFVKTQLQRQLAAATGWQLRIDGDLLLDWGKNSVIVARELGLSNPQAPQAQELFSAAQLRLQFQPLALLGFRLDMQDLQLQDCSASLVRDADGGSNWSLVGKAEEDQPDQAGETGFSWNLARLEIRSCSLHVSSAEQPEPLHARLDQALLQVDAQQILSASIDGALDQQPLSLQGSISPLPALWQGGYLQHTIDLQAGEIRLHSEGSVADLHTGEEVELSFRFSGPEFGKITQWLALPQFSHGEFDADISVRREVGNPNMLIGVDADLGSLELQGNGELDKLLAPAQGKLALQVNGPDLQALGETFGVPGLLARAFAAKFIAAIEDSETRLESMRVDTGADYLQASGVLGPWPQLRGTTVEVKLHSVDLAAWLAHTTDLVLPFNGIDSSFRLAKDAQSIIRLDGNGKLVRSNTESRTFTLGAAVSQQDHGMSLQQLKVELGADSLELSGNLELADNFSGSEVDTVLRLADLSTFGQWLELDLPDLPARPLHVQAQLRLPGQGLEFTIAANETSEQKLHLVGEIPDLRNLLAMNAQFDVELPSLSLAQFLAADLDLPDLPFSAGGMVRHDASRHHTRVQDVNLRLGQATATLQADLLLQNKLEGSTARWKMQGQEWEEFWPDAPAEFTSGEISSSGEWRRSAGAEEFSIDIRGEDASRLNPLVGPLFDSQPFELQFTARVKPGHFSSQDIRFRQAKTDFTAELDLQLAERPLIKSKLRSSTLDLTPLQQHVLANRAAQPAAKTAGRDLLFPDEAIELVGDMPVDLTLDLAVDNLLFGPNHLQQLRFGLELSPQSLQLNDFAFQGAKGGSYAGQFSAQREGDVTALSLKARAEDLKLGLVGVSGQDPDLLPPSDIRLDLAGRGRTWHELAQTLTGKTRWFVGAGRVSATSLDFLFSDLLTQIFSTLNPLSKKSQYTQLNCGVYAAESLNGQVKLAPIVIQTDQITAFSEGQINLSTEAVEMGFRTVPRKGLGISAGAVVNPFFKIGGTLMKPALQLDVTKGAISGGVMVATAGLSVLFKSFSDRLMTSKDPCGDARAGIEANDGKMDAE